jgi:hypothetical protein
MRKGVIEFSPKKNIPLLLSVGQSHLKNIIKAVPAWRLVSAFPRQTSTHAHNQIIIGLCSER